MMPKPSFTKNPIITKNMTIPETLAPPCTLGKCGRLVNVGHANGDFFRGGIDIGFVDIMPPNLIKIKVM